MKTKPDHIADARRRNWVETHAPTQARPYLQLARYDRPIGFWLLLIPCWAGMALARLDQGWVWSDLTLILLFLVGALAMRGAGCTYNDILDRDLDAKVARTNNRPLANGTLNVRQATGFLALQLAIGFAVWLALPTLAKQVALAALPLVALYPLMKRIVWWPQAWLGLTFNWGVLVGYVAISDQFSPPVWLFYAGFAFWTLGYDTIYAHQDREDDAMIGVKSTARLFGRHSKVAIGIIYFLSITLLLFAANQQAAELLPSLQKQAQYGVLLASGLFALNLSNQAFSTNFDDPDQCLSVFKSNSRAGFEYVFLLAVAPVFMSWLMQLTGQ
ncbi:MAG: 4-hydroxybenzoate octaprenyltransferase [Robiginitomaculum sp.]|nr:MAG: 4-hydroxybenzoate octaprenyltransferase [Robiginitomaculum sp.]